MMKGLMTPEQHAEFVIKAAADYEPVIKEMKELAQEIAILASQYDPVKMLTHAYWNHITSLSGLESEAEMGEEQNDSFSAIEYIQSCIISKQPQIPYKSYDKNEWESLKEKISTLYSDAVLRYHIANTAKRKQMGQSNESDDELYFQLVTFWVKVRGKRYLQHEEVHLADLLTPHDDVLIELFGINGSEIAKEVFSMQLSLVNGPRAIVDFKKFQEKISEEMLKKLERLQAAGEVITNEKFKSTAGTIVDDLGLRSSADDIMGKFLGTDLFDVQKVTKLPTQLLNELSHTPGQDSEFLSKGKFVGTPLQKLPVQTFPILKVNGKFYVFHPHILSDHLYRNLQAVVVKNKPKYLDKWNNRQKEISEKLPFDILQPLLPGAVVHTNFQYFGIDRAGLQNWIECDGVIIFDGLLFIVEAKGGKASNKAPAQNIDSHFESVRDLLSAPADQGRRFAKYLQDNGKVEIFDSKKQLINTLDSAEYKHTVIVAVSLEQLSDISPRVQHFAKLGLEDGLPVWMVSVDDLRVYKDIFKSPICFTHFIVERLRAFENKRLVLYDELDHLGLYLSRGRYHNLTDNFESDVRMVWNGFRTELDKYFHQLLVDPSKAVIPAQTIPSEIKSILTVLERESKPGFVRVGHQLLDFDEQGRINIANSVRNISKAQAEQKMVNPFSFPTEKSISFVLFSPDVVVPQSFNARDYALSNMVAQGKKEVLLLEITLNRELEIISINFDWLTDSVLVGEYAELIKEKAEVLIEQRLQKASRNSKKGKISRNQLCPCGSNLKYKKCHGV